MLLQRLQHAYNQQLADGGSALLPGSSALLDEFGALFSESGSTTAVENSSAGPDSSSSKIRDCSSIGVQTDNIAPVTVLKSVNVGVRQGPPSFFTDATLSDSDDELAINKSET